MKTYAVIIERTVTDYIQGRIYGIIDTITHRCKRRYAIAVTEDTCVIFTFDATKRQFRKIRKMLKTRFDHNRIKIKYEEGL